MYLSQFPVTSPYGMRGGVLHAGVDIGCPPGTPLPALVDGTIVFEGFIKAAAPGFRDEIIVILQADGYFIVYGHLSTTLVNIDQKVKAGDIIARSGNTGYVLPKPRGNNDVVSGAHLHIEERLGTKSSSKGLLAYTPRDITPRLQAYGTTPPAQGGAHDMTRLEHYKEVARLILDVIEGDPHYEEKRKDIFDAHVYAMHDSQEPLEDRRWAKGIMRNNGVLNGPDMRRLREEHEKQLGALDKENVLLRSEFDKKTVELNQRINDLDEANQVLASQANDAKAIIQQKVEESNGLKSRVRELETQLKEAQEAPSAPTGPIEQYSALELIRMGLNKFLKGQ